MFLFNVYRNPNPPHKYSELNLILEHLLEQPHFYSTTTRLFIKPFNNSCNKAMHIKSLRIFKYLIYIMITHSNYLAFASWYLMKQQCSAVRHRGSLQNQQTTVDRRMLACMVCRCCTQVKPHRLQVGCGNSAPAQTLEYYQSVSGCQHTVAF